MNQPVVIVSAKRTAIGSFQGQFAETSADELGAVAIRAAVAAAGIDPAAVDDVIMGCVLTAGIGQAPARRAAIKAGIPVSAGALTVNKVCSSGLVAVQHAHDRIVAGSAEIVVAGGMESMSLAPYLLPKARSGYRMGHGELLDHMFTDGLQDPDEKLMMGVYGERCAAKYNFSRAAMDAFAAESVVRSLRAMDSEFPAEIAPVLVRTRKGDITVARDEEPPRCDLERMATLKPAFAKDGSVTAATSSKISDGAAALVLMSATRAQTLGVKPLARIVAQATFSQEPGWFTTAPVGAIAKIFAKTGWTVADVDLFDVNEAFAAVTMAAMHEHGIAHAKMNVNGGACALGHPIGASGARILTSLLNALRQRSGKRGVVAICNGGGEATALAVELL